VDFIARDFHRAETVTFGVGHAPERDVKAGIPCAPEGHERQKDALLQGRNHITLRLQYLSGRKVGSIAEQVNARRFVQLPLMVKARIERAGFGFRLRVSVVSRLAVGRGVAVVPSGGGRITVHADRRIHRHTGGAVVVVSGGDGAGDNVVPGPHIPHRFRRAVEQARRLAVWQAHIKPVVKWLSAKI